MANGVSYVISLESRQFLQELRKAKDEAKKASKEISQSQGEASQGGQQLSSGLDKVAKSIKRVSSEAATSGKSVTEITGQFRSASQMAQGFNAASSALSQALSGNLVGAAASATKAMASLTASMLANPILLVVSALAGLGIALYNAAKSYEEYRNRCREAREENTKFHESLYDMEHGSELDRRRERIERSFANGNMPSQRTIDRATAHVDSAREAAQAASDALEAEQTKRRPDEKQVELLREKRDAAKEEFENALKVKQIYDELIEKRRKERQEISAANADELKRQELANAEGDPEAMKKMYDKMLAETNNKFGSAEAYQDRLKDGRASTDEIAARKALEDYFKKITETTNSLMEKAEREAQKALADADKLSKAREGMMVTSGDREGLEKLLGEKKDEADKKFGSAEGKEIASMSQDELDARAEILRIEKELQALKDEEARKEKEHLADAEKLAQARIKALVNAGDSKALAQLAEKMLKEVDKKFGAWTPEKALTASKEELDARAKVESIQEAAKKAGEPARKAAADAAKKAQELAEKKDAFLHRNDSAAQQLNRNRAALREAQKVGDAEKMLELMEEGEKLADNFQAPMTLGQRKRAERQAKRDARDALKAAKAYRRDVSRIEHEWAAEGKEKAAESKNAPTVKVEGQDKMQAALDDIKEALQ